jgi:hypothetical protein
LAVTTKSLRTCTVANGQSLSPYADFQGYWPAAFRVRGPAQGTHLVFKRRDFEMEGYWRDAGAAKQSCAFVVDDWCGLEPGLLPSWDDLAVQICSDASGTPQNQNQAVAIDFIVIAD